MGSLSTPAIVLRAVNYGEADRVVTLFGRDDRAALGARARRAQEPAPLRGRARARARRHRLAARARRGRSADAGELRCDDRVRARCGADVARMAHAAYVAELVTKLCAPRQVELAIYDWLATFLDLSRRRGRQRRALARLRAGPARPPRFRPRCRRAASSAAATRPPGPTAGTPIAAARSARLRARRPPDPPRGARGAGAARCDVSLRRCGRHERSRPTSTAAAARRCSRSSSSTSAVRSSRWNS